MNAANSSRRTAPPNTKAQRCQTDFALRNIYDGRDLAQTYKSFTTSYATTIFWGLWWVFIALCVFGFVVLDNQWLEDRRA